MAEQTDTFLREVQEDIRRERMARIWDQYGMLIIGAAVLLVAGVGTYKYMEYRTRVDREEAGVRFEAAARLAGQGKAEEARKAFADLSSGSPAGYVALAKLRAAGSLAGADKAAEAVALYDGVARDSAVDPLLRDYAAVQAALLRVDVADWTEMQNRLKDVVNEKNSWRNSARELLGLSAMRAGRDDDAKKAFEQILGDRAAPPSLVERARTMMTVLTEAALAKGATAPTPAPAGGTPKAGDKGGGPTPAAADPAAAKK